jgi:hypothetical protein
MVWPLSNQKLYRVYTRLQCLLPDEVCADDAQVSWT